MREIIADATTLVTRSRTIENQHSLAPRFLDDMMKRYGGSTLARQELEGEMILDDPDALFLVRTLTAHVYMRYRR